MAKSLQREDCTISPVAPREKQPDQCTDPPLKTQSLSVQIIMKVNSVVRLRGFHLFRRATLLLIAVVIATSIGGRQLVAQTESGERQLSLAALQSSYQTARLDASVPFSKELKTLVDGYRAALERLQDTLQAEGALEELLEVRGDLASLQTGGQPGTAETKNARLTKLRGIFTESRQSIVARQAAAMQQVSMTYKSALEALVPELTKAGKVEDAVKAKAMAAAIKVDDGGAEVAGAGRPGNGFNDDDTSGGIPGAGEIPVKVTSRAEQRLAEVPEIEAPPVGDDIFSNSDWPLLVAIPKGDFKIEGKVEIKKETGRVLAIAEGSTFRGKGKTPYWNVGNSLTTGKLLKFQDINFSGNLGSKLYFEQCTFKDMLLGKGGGWFGGAFMSRWQFRNCAIEGSFSDVWGSRHTGVQMLGCRIERVKFPSIEYHNEDEPSAIALNDEMMILESYFYQCEIPVSVLSLTEDCVFVDCRFVDDPEPLTFAEKVKRTLKVENCEVKYAPIPANLEFVLEELERH